MAKFQVLREHDGDKFYRVGDTREANPNDVRHLIKNGVLALVDEVENRANKAEKPQKVK